MSFHTYQNRFGRIRRVSITHDPRVGGELSISSDHPDAVAFNRSPVRPTRQHRYIRSSSR
jgi:hypothetical protein